MVRAFNYLDLCPELERHEAFFRVRLDQDLLGKFLARYDINLVTVELCNQFAVRCVRANANESLVLDRLLPASLRHLSDVDIRTFSHLSGRVSQEQRGGTVQIYACDGSAQSSDLFCSVTVMGARS
ncbi:hypothetical protein C4J98_3381 [Pseudomonas orientalis]|uniref:hypothetical protein n=1 Tax=Pseudomonas orientalis TaxID=76758 RepID=UPI000F58126C|nr:hypothetical protein [Pseudomonas orientalis]AZE84787.1 hypothetical protein C4J98_3381 [Pseudomonas orientalis]